jgi:hypothetical protein
MTDHAIEITGGSKNKLLVDIKINGNRNHAEDHRLVLQEKELSLTSDM